MALPLAETPSPPRTVVRALAVAVIVLLVGALAAAAAVGGKQETVAASVVIDAVTSGAGDGISYSFDASTVVSFGTPFSAGFRTTGQVDPATGRTSLTQEFDGTDAPDVTVVSDGTTAYLRVPKENLVRTEGQRWAGVAANAELLAQLGAVAGQDRAILFEGAARRAVVVGDDEVRGAKTTKYQVRLDAQRVLDQLLAALNRQVGLPLDQLAGDLTVEVDPADVWIDGQDRLRRLDVMLRISAGGVTGRIALSQQLFGFGEAVTIEIPPADQVHLVGDVAAFTALTRSAPEAASGS